MKCQKSISISYVYIGDMFFEFSTEAFLIECRLDILCLIFPKKKEMRMMKNRYSIPTGRIGYFRMIMIRKESNLAR